MSNEWDDYAAGWDNNPAVIEYADKAFASLTNSLSLSGTRVLDFGCGTGQLTQRLSAQVDEVVALDPSQKMVEVLAAKQLNNVSVVANVLTPELAENAPHFQQTFDLIVASSSLAFVPDYRYTLSLLATLLSPGGHLVQWDWLKANDNQTNGFTQQEIALAMEIARLDLTFIDTAFVMQSGEHSMPVLMAMATKS